MAEKRKIGSSWQSLTGTGPYYKENSVISRLFSGEPNIFGRRAKKETSPEAGVPIKAAPKAPPKAAAKPERPKPVADVSTKTAPKAAPKPAAKPERSMPVADAPTKAVPKAAAKPKVDRMKEFMADLESKNPKDAVLEKLRKRAEMGETGKPLSSDNQYADRFKKFGFAKGGHVKTDGCAKKGKTRGRII